MHERDDRHTTRTYNTYTQHIHTAQTYNTDNAPPFKDALCRCIRQVVQVLCMVTACCICCIVCCMSLSPPWQVPNLVMMSVHSSKSLADAWHLRCASTQTFVSRLAFRTEGLLDSSHLASNEKVSSALKVRHQIGNKMVHLQELGLSIHLRQPTQIFNVYYKPMIC